MTDSTGLTVDEVFTVSVTDIDEVISVSANMFAEDVASGTSVVTFSRTDQFQGMAGLTLVYVPTSGEMILQNTSTSAIDINTFVLMSPAQKLNQETGILPPDLGFLVVNNDNAAADGGIHSEISFTSFNANQVLFTLDAGTIWNFGAVAEQGLTAAELTDSFSLSAILELRDENDQPIPSDGKFLYREVVGGVGHDSVYGEIAHGFAAFSYELVAGVGDEDNSLFTIADGVLYANTAFDYETK